MKIFVNAYAVSRNYGGPEEGGWWYDSGVALASVPVLTEDEAEIEKKKLVSLFKEYQDEFSRFSVADGTDLVVIFEEEFAKDYPEETPHYE